MNEPASEDTFKFVRYSVSAIPSGANPEIENATNTLTIDVFPHRLDLKTTLDDFITGLLWQVTSQSPDPIPGYLDGIFRIMSEQGYDTPTDLPFGRLNPGAIALSPGYQGADKTMFITDTDFYALDGKVYNRPTFANFVSYESNHRHTAEYFLDDADPDVRMKIMLSLIASMMPIKGSDPRSAYSLGAALIARISRLVDIQTPAGLVGAEKATKNFQTLYRKLQVSWNIRPDRPWSPNSYTASDLLLDAVSKIGSDIREFTDVLVKCAPAKVDVQFKSRAISWSSEGISNHQALYLKAAITEIDKAIIRFAPEEILKPGAARRRAALEKK